jgi:DNA invertase Pin-like site-specific DNA recombinase
VDKTISERGLATLSKRPSVGIAEFERELIRQRTDEGSQAGRKRGVSFGQLSKLRLDQRELAARLLQEDRSVYRYGPTLCA